MQVVGAEALRRIGRCLPGTSWTQHRLFMQFPREGAIMTAAEWDDAPRSDWMLLPLHERLLADPGSGRVLDRKLRLFAVECCRQRWELFTKPIYRVAVDASERYADGRIGRNELEALYGEIMTLPCEDAATHSVEEVCLKLTGASGEQASLGAVMYLSTATGWNDFSAITAVQAPLLRCIIGNPFRPVALAPNWKTTTVVALAQGIYDDRAFDRLPILADALQDAGCDSEEMLAHCCGDGPHARGCWVVDLVLGKQ